MAPLLTGDAPPGGCGKLAVFEKLMDLLTFSRLSARPVEHLFHRLLRAGAVQSSGINGSVACLDCIRVEFIEPVGLRWGRHMVVLQQIEQGDEIVRAPEFNPVGTEYRLERFFYRLLGVKPDDRITDAITSRQESTGCKVLLRRGQQQSKNWLI